MAATRRTAALRHRPPQPSLDPRKEQHPLDYPVRLIRQVCWLARSPTMIEDVQAEFKAAGLAAAVRRHATAAIFDWLIEAVSYQGIADQVAHDYIRRHGTVTWAEIKANLASGMTCPKLTTY